MCANGCGIWSTEGGKRKGEVGVYGEDDSRTRKKLSPGGLLFIARVIRLIVRQTPVVDISIRRRTLLFQAKISTVVTKTINKRNEEMLTDRANVSTGRIDKKKKNPGAK